MSEDKCSRCGKVIKLYEPYREDEDGVKTHIYPERYCRNLDEIIIAGVWCLEYYADDPPYKWEREQ